MSFDDLDLEFEDEEEEQKKKGPVHVDVDLRFHSIGDVTRTRSGIVPMSSISIEKTLTTTKIADIKKLDEARSLKSTRTGPVNSISSSSNAGGAALKVQPVDQSEVRNLEEKMRRLEIDSAVKVATAEYKTQYLAEMLSDMKILDLQVTQMLIKINAKHPDMKREVMMIKKLLADFTKKKRK